MRDGSIPNKSIARIAVGMFYDAYFFIKSVLWQSSAGKWCELLRLWPTGAILSVVMSALRVLLWARSSQSLLLRFLQDMLLLLM